jgi:NTP pyrophosphatase (non-canonical NTP hydrolase)
MTKQADNGVALNPTIEAGVVNALQEECGRTAAEHGFSRDWVLADFLEVVGRWLTKGDYSIGEIYTDLGIDYPDDMTPEEAGEQAGEVVTLTADVLRNNIMGTKLMLIVSELAEGLESLRENGGVVGALDGKGNLDEELADTIVRVLDTGTFIKANLGDALLHKMAVNKDRPHMHGNKAM